MTPMPHGFVSTCIARSVLIAALSALPLGALAAAKVGEQAPSFTLTGNDGKTYKLEELKGKHVVLEWFNQDCPFVVKHYGSGNMQKLQKAYTEKGVVWLTVASSAPGKQGHLTAEQATQVKSEQKASSTAFLLDPDGKVGKSYNAKTTPHMYIINPAGKLVYAGAIDDKPTTDVADIAPAKNYVVAALDASLAGKPVEKASTTAYGCSIKYK